MKRDPARITVWRLTVQRISTGETGSAGLYRGTRAEAEAHLAAGIAAEGSGDLIPHTITERT